MPKLPAISEGFKRLQNFWEHISTSNRDNSSSRSNRRRSSGNSSVGLGASSPSLLEGGGTDAAAVPMSRGAGGRGSAREGIRRRIEAFEEIISTNCDSRRSSISDASKVERAEIILRNHEVMLLDRAQYQSVFDERVGLDFSGNGHLQDALSISEDEDGASEEPGEFGAVGGSPSQEDPLPEQQQQQQQQEDQSLVGLLSGGGPARPLWRNMPEVIEAGLAESLGKEEMKLQEALFEILTSEASYYKNLSLIIEVFYKNHRLDHTRPDACIKPLDKHYLFSNIVDIFECSAEFLKSMEDEWKKSPKLDWVSDVILANINGFRVYKDYCRNFYYQTKTLQKLRANVEFQQLIAQLENLPACRMMGLQSYLEMPMRRIMSLQLLMHAAVGRMSDNLPTYQSAINAFGQLLTLARECDQESKMMSEKEQMLQLQNRLYFSKVKKVGCWGGNRHLIKEGQLRVISAVPNVQGFVNKISIKRSYLQLHAFSDLLIISKPKGQDEFSVLKHSPRAYVDAELLANRGATGSARHQLRLRIVDDSDGTPAVTLVLEPKSREEADRWIAIFCPRDELGDPVYEADDCPQVQVVRDYAALQKDDLELRVGEIVNVYKKTDEGWYLGSRLTDPSVRGWFAASHVKEIENDHFRAKIRKVSFRRKHAMATYVRNKMYS